MVVRFYFGLTKPNFFNTKMVAKQLSSWNIQATVFHWLFEASGMDRRIGTREKFKSDPGVLWITMCWGFVSLTINFSGY